MNLFYSITTVQSIQSRFGKNLKKFCMCGIKSMSFLLQVTFLSAGTTQWNSTRSGDIYAGNDKENQKVSMAKHQEHPPQAHNIHTHIYTNWAQKIWMAQVFNPAPSWCSLKTLSSVHLETWGLKAVKVSQASLAKKILRKTYRGCNLWLSLCWILPRWDCSLQLFSSVTHFLIKQ